VLVGGARDAPKRQRTLRATIDWSYNLLTSKERRAFAHMAVFAGGATVAAAEAITGASLDMLDSLVAKQLVAHRDERLVMLETVREYALERLAEDPDADAVELRLAEWCREFAREATPHLPQADRVTWLTRLDAEFPNILAALSGAREQRRSELLLELLGEIGDYWWHTNRWHEGLTWFNAALEHTPSASDHARAKALLYRARLTDAHQSYEELRGDLEASLSLFRACDDAAGIAACLGHLAFVEAWRGRFELAETLAADSQLLRGCLRPCSRSAQRFSEQSRAAARDVRAYLRQETRVVEAARRSDLARALLDAEKDGRISRVEATDIMVLLLAAAIKPGSTDRLAG
jgi:tetratricopeptide (TPR) repeat protein